MDIQKLVTDVEKYLKWSGQDGTTQQEYQEFVRNIFNVAMNLILSVQMWQPQSQYEYDTVIKSSSMHKNTKAKVIVAGTTGISEPEWSDVGEQVTDGTVTYIIVPDTIDFSSYQEVQDGKITNKIVSPAVLKEALSNGLAPKLDISSLTNVFLYNLLHSKGANFLPSDVSNNGWNKEGLFISSYNRNVLKNQPNQYGQLLNIPFDLGTESTQIWMDQNSGKIRYRCGNGSTAVNDALFKSCPTEDELNSTVSSLKSLISSAASSGGVVAGNVSNANAWWVKLGGTIPLIIQGGKASGNYIITFPIAFTSIVTACSNASNKSEAMNIYGLNTKRLELHNNGGYPDKFWWIAIGY